MSLVLYFYMLFQTFVSAKLFIGMGVENFQYFVMCNPMCILKRFCINVASEKYLLQYVQTKIY